MKADTEAERQIEIIVPISCTDQTCGDCLHYTTTGCTVFGELLESTGIATDHLNYGHRLLRCNACHESEARASGLLADRELTEMELDVMVDVG